MIIELTYNDELYKSDLSKPLDISIPVGRVRCFYSTHFSTTPYVSGDWIGSVKEGAPVNFFDIQMNPHGNGTHTECLGHITAAHEYITESMNQYHFIAKVISVVLDEVNGDRILSQDTLEKACGKEIPEALIIRTLPNRGDKLSKDYSGTNPPYLSAGAMRFITEAGVKHLLLDLPSVDRELDDGKLENHKIFWKVEGIVASVKSRIDATISEMIFVSNDIEDGIYLLNIQIPSIELDAVPSKPVLYKLQKQN